MRRFGHQNCRNRGSFVVITARSIFEVRLAGFLLACTRVENPAPRSQEGPQREMHIFGHQNCKNFESLQMASRFSLILKKSRRCAAADQARARPAAHLKSRRGRSGQIRADPGRSGQIGADPGRAGRRFQGSRTPRFYLKRPLPQGAGNLCSLARLPSAAARRAKQMGGGAPPLHTPPAH